MTPYDTDKGIDWKSVLSGVPTECSLKHIHHLGRHGTRTPSKKLIQRVTAVVEKLKAAIPNAALSTWQSSLEGGEFLTGKGVEEQQFLAEQYVNLYKLYGLDGFIYFASTNTNRTIESSQIFRDHFAVLTEDNEANFSIVDNFIDEEHLRFFEWCRKYVEEVKENDKSRLEFTNIGQTSRALQIVSDFNRRNFGDLNLNFDEIFQLYYMAGYEMAANGFSSLVEMFKKEDLEFFDYADDVETYWKQSYPYEINYKSSFGLIKFIFQLADSLKLETTADRVNGKTVGVFQFGHSETLIPVMTTFGLYKDSLPLNANATLDFIQNRHFKCSKMSPFSANIDFLFVIHALVFCLLFLTSFLFYNP